MSDYGTLGWRYYTFSPKRRCVACNRKVYVGVVGVNQIGREREPDFKVLCRACYRSLDDDPGEFADAQVPEQERG